MLCGQCPGLGATAAAVLQSSSDSAGVRQDRTLKELEEAQKLDLRLNNIYGRGLSSQEAPGPGSHRGVCSHRGDEDEFRKFFAPLCRALPLTLPKLRELVLDLRFHGSRFGPGPGGLSGARGAEKESSSFRWKAMTMPGPWPWASANKRSWSG